MTDLRTAVTSDKKPYKVYDTSRPGDSTYRKRLIELLQSVDEGYEGVRLEKALLFFDREWVHRDQSFLRKFARWAKDAKQPTEEDLKDLIKFGISTDPVGLKAIVNGLRISFEDALFRVLALVALGVAERGATFNADDVRVRFSTAAEIEFVLGVIGYEMFDDEEARLLMGFFRPELDANLPQAALRVIAAGVDAVERRRADPTSGDVPIPDMLTLLRQQDDKFRSVGDLADELEVSAGLATFTLLVLALAGYGIERSAPYFLREGSKGTSYLRVRYVVAQNDPLSFDETEDDVIEMGDLTAEEHLGLLSGDLGKVPKAFAKEAFATAQEQSEALQSDPTLPGPARNGNGHPTLDDLDEIFGEFEKDTDTTIDMEPSRQEMIDMMATMENSIQAAEDLAGRVAELENQVNVLRGTISPKMDAIMAHLGLPVTAVRSHIEADEEDAPPDMERLDQLMMERIRETTAKEAARLVRELAPKFMPNSRLNNKNLRSLKAMELADAVLDGLGFDPHPLFNLVLED